MTELTLLNDNQLQSFLRDGYIIVDANMPAEFHAQIDRQIDDLFNGEGNPGNEILSRIPDLQEVLARPAVTGALMSLLGPDYLLHPHRHCHQNVPGSEGQHMHQDSYEADQNVRHHRLRWLMALYYPQDVDGQMGPSSIVPGTQYLTAEDQHGSPDELPLLGPAGTVTIIHYDMWHRAAANVGERNRFMVKFLFTRMSEPRTPAWQHNGRGWKSTGHVDDVLCANLWDWLRGEGTRGDGVGCDESAAMLSRRLSDGRESIRHDAAYRLGLMGKEGVPLLVDALCKEAAGRLKVNIERQHTNPAQFDTAYGLTAAGPAALPTLMEFLGDDAWWLRASAADVLGDIGLEATPSVPALTGALKDESDWVRRNAVEALGNIGSDAAPARKALAECLTDIDEAVRHNAALALAKIGSGDVAALNAASEDENRCVRELSAEALARLG